MLSRRDFLGRSALIALAPTVPLFLARSVRAAAPQRDGRVLVVVQLSGGNDGLNTVVPFKDEGYLKNRKALRLAERVAVLIFSEFGRQVRENASAGTDHGTAAPVFLAGAGVCGGLLGTAPNLLDLVGNAPKMTMDFRRVYATVLEDWLGLPAKDSLGGAFERLPLFRA